MGKADLNLARIPALAAILTLCLVLTFFLQSRGHETVYTHLFYVPIILSSIWWQKKGVATAFFLGIALIFAHQLFRPDTSFVDDILRALIFLVIATLVAGLSSEAKTKGDVLEDEIRLVKAKSDELIRKNDALIKTQNDFSQAVRELDLKTQEADRLFKLSMDKKDKT